MVRDRILWKFLLVFAAVVVTKCNTTCRVTAYFIYTHVFLLSFLSLRSMNNSEKYRVSLQQLYNSTL